MEKRRRERRDRSTRRMITLSRRVEKSIETGKNVQGWKARSEVCDKEMRKQKKTTKKSK